MYYLKHIFLWGFLLIYFYINAQSNKTENISFHISLSSGNEGDGSLQHPFGSFGPVIKKINSIKSDCIINIFIHAGYYYIDSTIELPQNTFVHEIKISNYKDDTVTLSGGKVIPSSYFQLADKGNTAFEIHPASVGKIYFADLNKLGNFKLGKLKMNGFKSQKTFSPAEIFQNDSSFTISRWPNNTQLSIDTVFNQGTDENSPNQEKPAFAYEGPSHRNWSNENDIWAAGVFGLGWAYDNLPVSSIDNIKRIVKLGAPASFGLYSNRESSQGRIIASKDVRGFYFYNIPEELDQPGEYYLDFDKKRLYVFPMYDIKNVPIFISINEKPILSISGKIPFRLENIKFSLVRGNLIDIKDAADVSINSCAFSNCGVYAISTKNVTNLTINLCRFSNSGAESIMLDGGNRKTLVGSKNQVIQCSFTSFGRLYKCYSPALRLSGVGHTITNCFIHDAPCQGIIYSGNDHIISNNHFKNLCYLFNDIGAVYTGRDPSATGTLIQNNFFDAIRNPNGNMVAAVYMDDGASGITVNNNLFYKCGTTDLQNGFGAVNITGGSDNYFNNNIFIECNRGFSISTMTMKVKKERFFYDSSRLKLFTKAVDIRSNIYLEKYPHLRSYFDTTSEIPRFNYINNTIAYKVHSVANEKIFKITSIFRTENNPGFNNIDNEDFRWAKFPEITKTWNNWVPFRVDLIKAPD